MWIFREFYFEVKYIEWPSSANCVDGGHVWLINWIRWVRGRLIRWISRWKVIDRDVERKKKAQPAKFNSGRQLCFNPDSFPDNWKSGSLSHVKILTFFSITWRSNYHVFHVNVIRILEIIEWFFSFRVMSLWEFRE